MVVGFNEDAFESSYGLTVNHGAAAAAMGGVGLDGTTPGGFYGYVGAATAATTGCGDFVFDTYVGLGAHYLQALEWCDSANTVTFFGVAGTTIGGALQVTGWF
jgi:hypothetical protein